MRFQNALIVVCGLALAASARQPTQPSAATAAANFPTPLYRMNDIGKSLNLTPEQVTNLNKLTDATQARYRDDYTKLGTLGEAERATQMWQLNQRYYADWNKGAADVFNDAQRTRYQQLNYQYGGFGALSDPEVQRQLSLTAEQQKNLPTHSSWSTQQMADINRAGVSDAARGAQMYRDYTTAQQQRMNQFLTPQQQQTWTRMTGSPYTFQPAFAPRR